MRKYINKLPRWVKIMISTVVVVTMPIWIIPFVGIRALFALAEDIWYNITKLADSL